MKLEGGNAVPGNAVAMRVARAVGLEGQMGGGV
jgi:hypothetical protein